MINNLMNELFFELNHLVNDLSEIDELLAGIEYGNEVQIEKKFFDLFKKYKCNPEIIGRFLTYLQINNSKSIEDYNLSDMKILFDKSCKVYNDMFGLNVEKYFYYKNILDEEKVAINELILLVNSFNNSEYGKVLELKFIDNKRRADEFQ